MLYNYIYYIIYTILENKALFYLIVLIFNLFLRIFLSTTLYLDGDDPTDTVYQDNPRQYRAYNPNYVLTSQGYRIESANRSVYELPDRLMNREYNAYNPNYVLTSEGYRTELENKEISTKGIERIPNPSHFYSDNRRVSSTLLGSIHSSDSGSNRVGFIEPTRSEIEFNGYYTGRNRDLETEYYESNSLSSTVKSKLRNGVKAIDRYYENNYHKSKVRESEINNYYKDLANFNEIKSNKIGNEKFIKDIGVCSKAELESLYRKGYTIRDGIIRKF